MSEADQVRISRVKESTWGTTPTAAVTTLRYSSDSFKKDTSSTESPEIGSRRTKDVSRTSTGASGGFNSTLSFGNLDDIFEAVLFAASTFTGESTTTDDLVTAAASDNSFNGTGAFSTYAVGDWVEAFGFTTAANNGFYKVTTQTANKIIVSGGTLSDDAASEGQRLKLGGKIVDAGTRTSFSVEKEFQDLSSTFQAVTGWVPGSLTVSADAGGDGLVQANVAGLGKDLTLETSTIGSSYTAAPTNRLMNVIDHTQSVLESQTAATMNSFTFTIDNTLRGVQNIGVLGNDDLLAGALSISGTITQHFVNTTILTKYVNFTDSSLAFVFDGDGGAYVFDFPAVNYTDGEVFATGRNADVIASLPFTAKEEGTEGIQVRIVRFSD